MGGITVAVRMALARFTRVCPYATEFSATIYRALVDGPSCGVRILASKLHIS